MYYPYYLNFAYIKLYNEKKEKPIYLISYEQQIVPVPLADHTFYA